MIKVSISTLKNRLSAYLDRVRAGQTVLILDRDRPIARIERVTSAGLPDDRLARLERAGLLRRAARPLSLQHLRDAGPGASQSVVAALLEERRHGR